MIFRLVYEKTTKIMKNAPGVETRVPGFGNTDTIEHLDTDNLVKYFAPMVDALVSWGYERGVTVRAAPYDFRYGPGKYLPSPRKLPPNTHTHPPTKGNKGCPSVTHRENFCRILETSFSAFLGCFRAFTKSYLCKLIQVALFGVLGGNLGRRKS